MVESNVHVYREIETEEEQHGGTGMVSYLSIVEGSLSSLHGRFIIKLNESNWLVLNLAYLLEHNLASIQRGKELAGG